MSSNLTLSAKLRHFRTMSLFLAGSHRRSPPPWRGSRLFAGLWNQLRAVALRKAADLLNERGIPSPGGGPLACAFTTEGGAQARTAAARPRSGDISEAALKDTRKKCARLVSDPQSDAGAEALVTRGGSAKYRSTLGI